MITTIDPKAIHARQKAYVSAIEKQGFDYGLTVAHAFIESIRDLGYKATGTAANENIDNAAQAGAENVHVAFGYREGSRKPISLAIMDDGIGMVPEMVRAATVWGGTDRHDSRDLYGRYGYGLPSSAVSQGRRFTVLSRIDDGPFWAVAIDLDEIAEGKYIEDGRVKVPPAVKADLPQFVTNYADEEFPGGSAALHTVVLWEKLDRLSFTRSENLENHLLETFGITYRNQLRNLNIGVNGKQVEPVDPLFLTEGARHFDFDHERAEALEPVTFEVRNQETRESQGTVKVRFSVMPPTFGRIDKKGEARGKNANPRFAILQAHNGLVVLRAGRQIDVVTKGLPTSFGNNDRYVKVEIDFPPSMDEMFGVTTHKQQITLSPRIIQALEENKVWKNLEIMRKRWREMQADLNAEWDAAPKVDDKRPSEIAMEDSAPLDPTAPPSDRRTKEAEEQRDKAIEDLVDQGVPRDDAENIVATGEKERPFRVTMEANPEGPFYRVELRGKQVLLVINTKHRFYTDVYASVKGTEGARIRQALEVLLFVIGKCEIEADEQRELFYKGERALWSTRLTTALAKLDSVMEAVPDATSETNMDTVVLED